jgi:hypothetical protein
MPLQVQELVPEHDPLPPRLFAQVTCVTPTLSEAVPPRVIGVDVVLYVEPDVGEVIVIVGAWVSGGVKVTVKTSVPLLLAASVAVTVSTFWPLCSAMLLQVQELVPEHDPLPPRLFAQVTCVTPTLSEAVPPRVIGVDVVLYVEPDVGEVIVIVGACVSGGVKVTVRMSVPLLLAASVAVTVSTFWPLCSTMLLQVQELVPEHDPLPPRLFAQITCVTPTLSEAVPPRVIGVDVVLYVEPDVGEVIVIVGGSVSEGFVDCCSTAINFPST